MTMIDTTLQICRMRYADRNQHRIAPYVSAHIDYGYNTFVITARYRVGSYNLRMNFFLTRAPFSQMPFSLVPSG